MIGILKKVSVDEEKEENEQNANKKPARPQKNIAKEKQSTVI